MDVEIKNTIRFDFGDGCAKPSLAEMADFVKVLDINAGAIEAAYRISEEKAVFIKCRSEQSMQYALANNNKELFFRYANGKRVKVCMSPASGYTQYVRVYGLPPELLDENLITVIGEYGTIRRVVREKFPAELGLDIHTGVRGVYMEVKKEIPPFLQFGNRKGNIFYDGIKHKCFLCKMNGHMMKSCPAKNDRKQEKKQQQSSTRRQDEVQTSTSYAAAVAEVPSADIMNDEEETLTGMDTEDISCPQQKEVEQNAQESEENAIQSQPIYQLASKLAMEIKRRNAEMNQNRPKDLSRNRNTEKEEAKIKSPPRKKKYDK